VGLPFGITSWGAYVPSARIQADVIAQAHGQDGTFLQNNLGIRQKSVPGVGEDAVTMAVSAGVGALLRATIQATELQAVYVGSESHPYAVKPSASMVSQALGVGKQCMAADLQFACKAGTAGLQVVMGLVGAGIIDQGMAIGSDTAQGRPGDALEYTAGAGAAAFTVGSDSNKIIAQCHATLSITTDTPDFWRRPGQQFPEHGERFTGVPSYVAHITDALEAIFQKTTMKATDFQHVILHQPNGKFPVLVAKKFGFTEQQLQQGMLVADIGNCYAASSMLGFASVLDVAKPGEHILLVSYGSGAGSDAFVFTIEKPILTLQKGKTLRTHLADTELFIDYTTYQTRIHG